MGFLTEMMSNITSIAASTVLLQSILNHFLPPQLLGLLLSLLHSFFPRVSTRLSMVVDEYSGLAVNELYVAAEAYLSTKISPSNNRLKVSKSSKENGFLITLDTGEEVVDVFDGVKIIWKSMICTESAENRFSYSHGGSSIKQTRSFELSFNKIHMDKVLNSYFPHILNRAKAIMEENTKVRIFTMKGYAGGNANGLWNSVVLDHPSTFETLAMEETQKAALVNDLKMFQERKQLYRQVGRAWKRGYLLYGPPGTGKSSLIAAIANFLKFDIYDLELNDVCRNSDLRSLLMATSNKSILVIEDIDCTKELKDRERSGDQAAVHSRWGPFELTLSGFLNFIDGLWSSCGDERIIIFTTNHKEKLDPALLRPGRMDMHIHMGYCNFSGFRILASNYLGIQDHPLFEDIRDLLQKVQITPAEVGEEFMRSQVDNPTAALQNLVDSLLRKEREKEEEQKEDGDEAVEDKENREHGGKVEGAKTEEENKLYVGSM